MYDTCTNSAKLISARPFVLQIIYYWARSFRKLKSFYFVMTGCQLKVCIADNVELKVTKSLFENLDENHKDRCYSKVKVTQKLTQLDVYLI